MARPPLTFFLELGSHHFKLVGVSGGTLTRSSMHVWTVPAKGIRKGIIVDATPAVAALESLIIKAEQFLGLGSVRSAKLLIPGYLLHCRSMETRTVLADGVVSASAQAELQDSLLSMTADEGHELIDSLVQAWTLDGSTSTQFPSEKRGRNLSLVAFCSTCDSDVLTALVQTCNSAGLEVIALGSSSAAASKLVAGLTPDASNRVLLDIGHSHSHMLLQVGSRMNSSHNVAIGSQHMTRDIAAALGCELPDAERMKHKLGLSIVQESLLALPPSRDGLEGASVASPEPATIYPWLAPRVSELLKHVYKHFALYAKALDGGVILFGGGSLLPGLTSFVASKWDSTGVTRFNPTIVSLSVALDVDLVCDNDDTLLGCEGLIGSASEHLQQMRADARTSFGIKGPQFLKPLLTWFSELAR